jgi:tetratricopeptide (TPR) repeat protein
MLVEQNRMEDAKVQFSSLVQQYPDDDELRYSLALVCLENKAWDEAQGYLEDLVARGSHVDSAHVNLGRIYEERNDPQTALSEYAQVGAGSDFLPAQLRQADILMSNGNTAEASKRLAQARADQPDYAIQLYLVEAETLVNNNQSDRGWQVLSQALKQYPDDLNLLYTRSMLAEKRNDLKQMESDLRAILKREPDNAMALNALGYTLSDRTTRYAEAKELIERAHQLNPETRRCSTASAGSTTAWAIWMKLSACCARRSSAFRIMKSPRTWAKSCGPKASSVKPAKCGARPLNNNLTARSCAAPSNA